MSTPLRRFYDTWLITRSQLYGTLMVGCGLLVMVAPALASSEMSLIVHETSGAVIILAGAVLTLTKDERCSPKIQRLNDILLRALARRLRVKRNSRHSA
jgi:hypothetical protein